MFGKNSIFARASSLILISALWGGCAASDADKIADGQDCLDRSTSETALSCLEKVDGLTSAGAELVRCSAYFIDQGFGEASRLAKVSEQLKDDSGGSGNATISVLSFMAFTASKYDKTTNTSLSDKSFAACQASKSKGMIYLSSMSRIATVALSIVGSYDPTSGVPPTQAQIEDGLCNQNDPVVRGAVGSAAQAAYEQNCVGKDVTQDPVCQQYAAAVGAGATPVDIGNELATNLCQ